VLLLKRSYGDYLGGASIVVWSVLVRDLAVALYLTAVGGIVDFLPVRRTGQN
jgi:hypothetical protein